MSVNFVDKISNHPLDASEMFALGQVSGKLEQAAKILKKSDHLVLFSLYQQIEKCREFSLTEYSERSGPLQSYSVAHFVRFGGSLRSYWWPTSIVLVAHFNRISGSLRPELVAHLVGICNPFTRRTICLIRARNNMPNGIRRKQNQLREQGYISGHELAAELGIPHSQLYRHVPGHQRVEIYEILTAKRILKMYKLIPDSQHQQTS